jgi:hypothetical protein
MTLHYSPCLRHLSRQDHVPQVLGMLRYEVTEAPDEPISSRVERLSFFASTKPQKGKQHASEGAMWLIRAGQSSLEHWLRCPQRVMPLSLKSKVLAVQPRDASRAIAQAITRAPAELGMREPRLPPISHAHHQFAPLVIDGVHRRTRLAIAAFKVCK